MTPAWLYDHASRALADLDAMQRWQTQPGSGPVAIRRVKAIRAAIRRLKQHPCRYPVGQYPGVCFGVQI